MKPRNQGGRPRLPAQVRMTPRELNLPPALWGLADRAARAEGIYTSVWIRGLVRDALRKRGLLAGE